MHTSRRTQLFTESVIREMTRVAQQHDAINLAQGFPDFPAPDLLKEAAARAINADLNQYAITWGAKRLREAVATKYYDWYGMDVNPETEVTVTCGATEAMVAVMLAVVDPGEEVIVFEPFYENYDRDTLLCGAKPVYVPMWGREELDLDRLADAFSDRTRAIVINTPNNPTGRLIPGRDLSGLCRRHPRTRFVVDESYLPFVRDAERESIARQGLANVIVLLSISKIFRIPGLRIGFLVAAPETVAACSQSVWPWSVNSLAHSAVQYIAEHPEPVREFVLATRGRLENEREIFRGLLERHPGFTVFPACASFMLVRLPEVISSGQAWAQLAEDRILIRDCSNFHGLSDRFIRICPKSPELSGR